MIVSGTKDCCPGLELGSDAVSFRVVGMRLVRPLSTNMLTCHLSASSKSRITSRRCPVCGMLLILSKWTRRSSFFVSFVFEDRQISCTEFVTLYLGMEFCVLKIVCVR